MHDEMFIIVTKNVYFLQCTFRFGFFVLFLPINKTPLSHQAMISMVDFMFSGVTKTTCQ